MKTEAEVKSALKAWVLKKAKISEGDLNEATPLLETRLISSLQVMELILEIEKIKGGRINIKSMKPGAFASIHNIYEAFFKA